MSDDDRRARFERLQRMVLEAQGLPAAERAAYVDGACGDDAELRREVEELLGDVSGADSLDADAAKLRAAAGEASTWAALIGQLESRGPGYQRYVFEGEIARGGMGVIHRVFDQDVRRPLALKVMLGRGEVASKGETPPVDDASLGRFLEEAQVTGQLDHPGIVPVHEVGVDGDGRVYFTMKLVKGEDLRSVFDRVADPGDDDWTTTRALNVMLRVCEAMAYAHEKGVIHRDLKPGNVMVGKFGEAYVMDWGLARVLGKDDPRDIRLRADESAPLRSERADAAAATPESPIVTMDGAVIGTPAYMPPEQAKGRIEDVGPAADVYAVGAMLYHLLARRVPYTEPDERLSPRTILAMVVRGAPPALTEFAPDAPAELVAIVEKAMEREIGDRYPDMTAFARDLRAFLEDRVVAAYETGAWAEAKKWVRRNRALAATAAAAVVSVLALAGWALVERETARENERTALANEEKAGRQQAAAEAERDRVLRLSDKLRLEVLVAEADALWPEHPEKVEALRDWLERADVLLENLPKHEETLAEVRTRGTRASPVDVPDESAEYDFGADVDSRWWHDAVRDLVVGLHALRADDVHAATVAGIGSRLEWAETVTEKTVTGAEVAVKWAEAREAVRAHPKYGGLDLKPQLGLVPLGPDQESTLWEFGHPRTGGVPVRDPETRKLTIGEETGLVFVLIPGGTYRLGAQAIDPEGPNYDPQADADESPVHEVTLSPYFLSKHEMTQSQWQGFSGTNPSYFQSQSEGPQTLQHPVEQVSWVLCRETSARLGLSLPTEAQWEAACRAGTGTPWSTGKGRNSLEGSANLADQAAKRAGATWTQIADWPELDDGFSVHAPVSWFRANGFGLHDMHGNVCEWCRDEYVAYADVPAKGGDGLRKGPGASVRRIFRGGAFDTHAAPARSAKRFRASPEHHNFGLGIRPARSLD